MKNFRSKQIIKAAKELLKIIKQRQVLESKEKALKEYFKVQMNGTDCAVADDILITLADYEKFSLDREQLEIDLGKKFQKYTKITKHTRFNIKKIKKEKRA